MRYGYNFLLGLIPTFFAGCVSQNYMAPTPYVPLVSEPKQSEIAAYGSLGFFDFLQAGVQGAYLPWRGLLLTAQASGYRATPYDSSRLRPNSVVNYDRITLRRRGYAYGAGIGWVIQKGGWGIFAQLGYDRGFSERSASQYHPRFPDPGTDAWHYRATAHADRVWLQVASRWRLPQPSQPRWTSYLDMGMRVGQARILRYTLAQETVSGSPSNMNKDLYILPKDGDSQVDFILGLAFVRGPLGIQVQGFLSQSDQADNWFAAPGLAGRFGLSFRFGPGTHLHLTRSPD